MTDVALKEAIERIFDAAPLALPRMRDVAISESENMSQMTFVINETNHANVSDIMYEISVDVFKIRSTSEWVIDLTSVPF